MSISLPDALKSFVDEQVAKRGYGTSSEYVRELIRADQDRQRLRKLLLDGAASPATAAADEAYFSGPQEPGPQSQSGVSKKPILPRLLARRDIEAALDHDNPAGPDVALGFIDALANHNDGADP